MSSALRRPFAGSVFAHALVLILGWLLLHDRDLRTTIPDSRIAGAVTVNLVRGHGGAGGASRDSESRKMPPTPSNARSPSKPRQTPRNPLRLGPDFSLRARDSLASGGANSAGIGSVNGDGNGGGEGGARDGYDVANAMDIVEESKLYPFFSALWRAIDAATDYPPDFVRERIRGYVTAQLEVNRQGVFTGKIVKVHSDQPLLEAYVLAVMFHALAEPLPAKLWSNHPTMILVARFDFQTFTFGELPPERKPRELKNVLEFARYGYVDPKLKQVIEKAITTYLPPIIPLPGAFYIDFLRMYELVRNFRHRHDVGADDLRAERIQLKREQWQEVVRKGVSGQEPTGSAPKESAGPTLPAEPAL